MKKTAMLTFCAIAVLVALWAFNAMSPYASAEPTVETENSHSQFETAVEIIKKYEGMHTPAHWPLVGYGHKVLPGEKYSRARALSEKEADALLRKDLLKNCAVFREYGKDSLILGVLAYNIGSGNVRRSTVAAKLKAGDRDIQKSYLAHCRYRGKEHAQIKRRRVEEFDRLFIVEKDTVKTPLTIISPLAAVTPLSALPSL